MIRVAILALALLAQPPTAVKVAGTQQIPAYQLATLKASNATAPLSWTVYQVSNVSRYEAGSDLVFTAPPGTYLVVLKAANGSSTWEIQFTPPTGPSPITPAPVSPPTPAPIPSPTPNPPQPLPDPSNGFIFPPDPSGFSASIQRALGASTGYKAEEAGAMSSLYSFIARKIRLDGERRQPGLQTLTQATALVKSEEAALLQGTTLRTLKQAFPEVAKVAQAEFARAMEGQGDSMTPRVRAAYVEFLQLLSMGFDQAVMTGQLNTTPPRPAPQ